MLPGERAALANQRTTTSGFGVSKRENHDASDFYSRFVTPEVSDDSAISPPLAVDQIFQGDSRHMDQVADGSVALVVTSPPYFAGKEYEQNLGQGHIPATYLDYLAMLEAVFAECVAKLEPGGRIAVNVANLGRKPYRSLSSDVIVILQDRLRLLLRGEIIWQKARGSTGSCAWGSFQRPANPVLRDLTERVVVASKGRFDRALSPRQRRTQGHPSEGLMNKDEFLEATTDVWEIPPESAHRVSHPAPFPVELPGRLIRLYTYHDDLVLDPFMGSGTTAVAAIRNGRHYTGYDTDPEYVATASRRAEQEKLRLTEPSEASSEAPIDLPAFTASGDEEDFQRRAVREGHAAKQLAEVLLTKCGFDSLQVSCKTPHGVEVNFSAYDATGGLWFFDVSGGFTSVRPGLKRTDTLWKALGKAAVLASAHPRVPLILLTTDVPEPGSAGDVALRAVKGPDRPIADVIQMRSPADQQRLIDIARTGRISVL